MDDYYVTPYDIVRRLLRRKPMWYHGAPEIKLEGEANTFGVLSFDFKDSVVKWNIYIFNRERVLDAAHLAILNFSAIANEIQF